MTEFAAIYYDGQSSRQNPVSVRIENGVCHIEGLATPLSYALTEVRISPRLGNTVRSLRLPGGALCETEANDAVDELTRAAGRAGGRWIHRLESGWGYAGGALAIVSVVMIVGVRWGIPLLAQRVAMSLPAAVVHDMGQGALAALDQSLFKPSTLEHKRRGELEGLFAGLAQAHPDLPLTLRFRQGAGPNAFALPDGTVVVTDELVALATDDAQVLAVLAHEVGHVQYRHALRMALETSAVALLASAYLGDVTQLASVTASLPALYANASYSRSHETEADLMARETLLTRGIALHHFPDILRRLADAYGEKDSPGALRYLSSHPATTEREALFR